MMQINFLCVELLSLFIHHNRLDLALIRGQVGAGGGGHSHKNQ